MRFPTLRTGREGLDNRPGLGYAGLGYAGRTSPLHPGCPQVQAISVVPFALSQRALQNFSPFRTVQLQAECAHFFGSAMIPP
jgi:hypothetical protein